MALIVPVAEGRSVVPKAYEQSQKLPLGFRSSLLGEDTEVWLLQLPDAQSLDIQSLEGATCEIDERSSLLRRNDKPTNDTLQLATLKLPEGGHSLHLFALPVSSYSLVTLLPHPDDPSAPQVRHVSTMAHGILLPTPSDSLLLTEGSAAAGSEGERKAAAAAAAAPHVVQGLASPLALPAPKQGKDKEKEKALSAKKRSKKGQEMDVGVKVDVGKGKKKNEEGNEGAKGADGKHADKKRKGGRDGDGSMGVHEETGKEEKQEGEGGRLGVKVEEDEAGLDGKEDVTRMNKKKKKKTMKVGGEGNHAVVRVKEEAEEAEIHRFTAMGGKVEILDDATAEVKVGRNGGEEVGSVECAKKKKEKKKKQKNNNKNDQDLGAEEERAEMGGDDDGEKEQPKETAKDGKEGVEEVGKKEKGKKTKKRKHQEDEVEVGTGSGGREAEEPSKGVDPVAVELFKQEKQQQQQGEEGARLKKVKKGNQGEGGRGKKGGRKDNSNGGTIHAADGSPECAPPSIKRKKNNQG